MTKIARIEDQLREVIEEVTLYRAPNGELYGTIEEAVTSMIAAACPGPITLAEARMPPETQVPERPSLYDHPGGAYNIAPVVDDLIDRVMVDPD